MELKDFLAAQRQMEKEIMIAAETAMERFEQKTQYTPNDIKIVVRDFTIVGDKFRKHYIAEVKINVSLEDEIEE